MKTSWALRPGQQAMILTALVAVLTFANTLPAGFVWDDRAAIVLNDDISSSSPWSNLLVHDFWGQNISTPYVGPCKLAWRPSADLPLCACRSSHKSFRPLTVASYKLNYLMAGREPWVFHATNVGLHAAVSALLIPLGELAGLPGPAAAFAALLFAVHPVHVEAVAGIVSRADLLSGLLFVAALLAYGASHNGQAWTWKWAAVAAAYALVAAASLAKEVGFTVLAGFVLYDLWLCGPAQLSGQARDGSSPTWLLSGLHATHTRGRVACSFLFAAIFMHFRMQVHRGAPLYEWSIMENRMALMPAGLARTLTVAYTHVEYAWLFVWPSDLSFDHGFDTPRIIEAVTDPRNVLSVALYACVFVVLWRSVAKRQATLLWCVGIAAASFLPASNTVMFVGTEVAERLLYIPSIGLCLAVAWAAPIPQTWEQMQWSSIRRATLRRKGTWALFACVLVAMLVRSVVRNEDWRDELSLYKAGVAVRPRSVKALNNYANILLNSKRPDALPLAADALQAAIDIYPDAGSAWHNLGLVHQRMRNTSGAAHHFWGCIYASHRTPCDCKHDLGQVYLSDFLATKLQSTGQDILLGEGGWAERYLAERHNRTLPGPRSLLLAKLLLEDFGACGTMTPNVHFHRAQVARELLGPHAAIAELRQGLQSAGTARVTHVHNLLGLTLQAIGKPHEALEHFEAALRDEPWDAALWSNAGNCLHELGRFSQALERHQKAYSTAPADSGIANNLAFSLELSGRYSDALLVLQAALAHHPTSAWLQARHDVLKDKLEALASLGVYGL